MLAREARLRFGTACKGAGEIASLQLSEPQKGE
jgi:hypothetical protein